MTRQARLSEAAEGAVLSQMLRRCSRPGCRVRSGLGFLPLVPPRRELSAGQIVVLCSACLRRARRGEFAGETMQLWRLRGMDYWENVGAE